MIVVVILFWLIPFLFTADAWYSFYVNDHSNKDEGFEGWPLWGVFAVSILSVTPGLNLLGMGVTIILMRDEEFLVDCWTKNSYIGKFLNKKV